MNKNLDNQLTYLTMEILKSNGFSVSGNCVIDKLKENGKTWITINGGTDFENRIKFKLKTLSNKKIVKKIDDMGSTWNMEAENFEENFKEIVEKMADLYEFRFVIDEEDNIQTDSYKFNDYFNDDNEEDAKILFSMI